MRAPLRADAPVVRPAAHPRPGGIERLGARVNAGSVTRDVDAGYTALLDVIESFKETSVDVFCWRVECLEAAGYDATASLSLARRYDVDLREACDLVTAGCSQELALRILR
jgi:hypothetical protein